MTTSSCSWRLWGALGAVVTMVLGVLLPNVPTRAGGVVSVPPEYFGSDAITETFEGVVNVLLPFDGPWPRSKLPTGWTLPASGATISYAASGDSPIIMDFDPQGYINPGAIIGYGLSLDGGDMYGRPGTAAGGPPPGAFPTQLPSYDSFLALGFDSPLRLTFETPVIAVGSYFEGAAFFGVGMMGDVTFVAYDANNSVLGSLNVVGDGVKFDHALDSWIGIATKDGSASIAWIEILGPLDNSGFRNAAVLDNLSIHVPEPAGVLGVIGIGVLLASRRRHQRR
jgi:hypothetical protein